MSDLPIYIDGRHYDRMFPPDPERVRAWVRIAGTYGDSLLELACGTGRISLSLAEAGFDVSGVDLSETMLAEARRKTTLSGVSVDWFHGDVRDFDLARTFPLILFPANSLGHLLTIDDFDRAMTAIRRHLTPTGVLVTEMFVPDLSLLTQSLGETRPFAAYDDPDGVGRVVWTYASRYDAASQIKYNTLFRSVGGGDKEVAGDLPMRIYFPRELDALFLHNGFEILHKYGDLNGTLFGPSSPVQVHVLRKNKR
ncbi:MAG: methyltransferase domain-containing protein [candidate division Zixibacteria bacterium]|nr:methyltransferase domain-containing protein [candidate division Zixibacteria bacterium]